MINAAAQHDFTKKDQFSTVKLDDIHTELTLDDGHIMKNQQELTSAPQNEIAQGNVDIQMNANEHGPSTVDSSSKKEQPTHPKS